MNDFLDSYKHSECSSNVSTADEHVEAEIKESPIHEDLFETSLYFDRSKQEFLCHFHKKSICFKHVIKNKF